MSQGTKDAPARPEAPLRLRIYRDLRGAIERGHWAPGARLPPTREHARTLGVSRNTVLWAMQRLQAEGYVLARVGDGSRVAPDLAGPGWVGGATLPSAPVSANAAALASTTADASASVLAMSSAAPAAAAAQQDLHPAAPTLSLSRRGQAMAETALRWQPPRQPAVPFRIGAPEVARFPFAVWDRLARQIPLAERHRLAQYLDPAGHGPLREAIAQWLWVSRGVRCDAGQVLVCSGSQQALDLVARLLLDPGDEVLVEDPGYPGIRAALAAQGAQVRPVPLDADGLAIDDGAARWPQARLVVATPSSQFPTGVRMGLKRRLALLDWAHRVGGWVVEDDYDGEFQYGPHRLPALCSLPQAQRVLYVGTFSKTLHPGLRLGFLVLPPTLLAAFAGARAMADRHAPGEPQAVLARFIADGHLLRHLNRMRELYAQRQQVLIDALAQATQGRVRLPAQAQGMHLLHEVAPGTPDLPLSAQAQAAGVLLAPLSRYTIASPRRGWLFGYAGYDSTALREAAARVGPILAALPDAPARPAAAAAAPVQATVSPPMVKPPPPARARRR